jgi:dinuclear metal center YbgI/SA1388 family protein
MSWAETKTCLKNFKHPAFSLIHFQPSVLHSKLLSLKLSEIISYFNTLAPFALQEGYDNSGLQVGDASLEITGALICLDVTEEIVDEAITLGFNLIISHHPVIFRPLKQLSTETETERLIFKAIQHGIALLSLHTNLDFVQGGVNTKICLKLGMKNCRMLRPSEDTLLKLAFFVPVKSAQQVRNAIFDAGAGVIGEYDMCSFNTNGTGTFRGSAHSDPYVGVSGKLHLEAEIKVETILPVWLRERVVKALLQNHPYEEVAYDLYPLKNINPAAGLGMIGELEQAMEENEFLTAVKSIFTAGCIRHTECTGRKIKKIAVCGGSGSSLINDAIRQGADAFLTADIKYHQFFDAGSRLLLADVGHYESEQFTKELIYELLNEKFPKFALRLTKINTNPINYL